MELTFGARLKHAWNAFTNRDPTYEYKSSGISSTYRPDRVRLSRGNERSIVTSVYNRIALDVSSLEFKHCKLDENGRFVKVIKSDLNNCLTVEANIDQTHRAFIHDVVMSMLDEGCVAIVPVDTNINPKNTNSYDILSMRTGKIIEWKPLEIKVRVYNDRTGEKEDIWVPKKMVAIIENPLYSVINEPNSTMQRLIRKLSLLDVTDEQTASGKLDLIIQLPYVIKTEARRQQAENRRKDIEDQLSGSKYGIAYTDGTEHITQLNRSIENNLMTQIEYLTNMVFSQIGMTQTILDGTADEQTMLNYYNRSIQPIVSAIVDEMNRKFLSKTARTQYQAITAFRDPFKLVPINNIAEIADKFTRNEILTSNEIRQIIGIKPSDDPKADKLINSNISQAKEGLEEAETEELGEEIQNGMTEEEYQQSLQDLDDLDSQLDDLESELDDEELKHYASPYYDPVKAHEYYMKNRELKGRRSTAKLNDEGKKAASYVKERLNTERKQKVQTHKDKTDSTIDSLRVQKKAKIEAHKEQMQGKIDNLREQLKSMSREDKNSNKERIYNEIASLRESNKRQRTMLQEQFKASSTSLRTDHKTERTRLKEEYDQKYIDELDKIRSEKKFQKVSKK